MHLASYLALALAPASLSPAQSNAVPPPPRLGASGSDFALTVVFVNQPGHPANAVPGLDVPFQAGGVPGTAFDRPNVSAHGARWIMRCVTMSDASADEVYLTHGGLLLQEGNAAPWDPTITVGSLDGDADINDAGDVLITHAAGGAMVVKRRCAVLFRAGQAPVLLARQGGPVAPILPELAGATWGAAMFAPRLINVGGYGWVAGGLGGTARGGGDGRVVHLANGVVAQAAVTVPAGQAGGGTAAWESFDRDGFHIAADGAIVLLQGDTAAASGIDDVVVRNGRVVLQEGQVVPGSGFAAPIDGDGIVRSWVDAGGNWFARGNNAGTEQDWVVRNGVVVARSGGADEIIAGSGEHWEDSDFADCFFAFAGNAGGSYLLGGATDGPAASNRVVVFDDGAGVRRIVCREGDPVDLDGNGRFDDDRFIDAFGLDRLRLIDDDSVLMVATLRDGSGAARDEGFFRLAPRFARCTACNGSGVNPAIFTCQTAPVLGAVWRSSIVTAVATRATGVLVAAEPAKFSFMGLELLINPVPNPLLALGNGSHALPIPNVADFVGLMLYTQGLRIDDPGGSLQLVLTNALDLRLGV